jgi:transcriptional regulator with XRE-family HTH domain
MTSASAPIGDLLRDWRRRRRMSQLDLASEAEITQKHLSFVESGRSAPSRAMVLRLAEHLAVPLRERNLMLLAAGHAPAFPERRLDDPDLGTARAVVRTVLRGHEPWPALAVDRRWTLVEANAAVAPLLAGVAEAALLRPPVNVLRLSLHPGGLAPRIEGLADWREHILARLRRQVHATADPALIELLRELAAYPMPHGGRRAPVEAAAIAVPLRLRTEAGVLSFLTTTTVFGTPLDVTLDELAIEAFYPADAATEAALRALAAARA